MVWCVGEVTLNTSVHQKHVSSTTVLPELLKTDPISSSTVDPNVGVCLLYLFISRILRFTYSRKVNIWVVESHTPFLRIDLILYKQITKSFYFDVVFCHKPGCHFSITLYKVF